MKIDFISIFPILFLPMESKLLKRKNDEKLYNTIVDANSVKDFFQSGYFYWGAVA